MWVMERLSEYAIAGLCVFAFFGTVVVFLGLVLPTILITARSMWAEVFRVWGY